MGGKVSARLRATDSLQALGGDRRRQADDVEPGVAPMRGHLPSARTGIVARAHGLQQHVVGGRAQGKAERPVSVVRIKPVVARLQRKGRGHAYGFMAGPGDLEEDFLLAFEQDLFIVHPSRSIHVAVGFDELFAGETFVGLAGSLNIAFGYCGRFRVSLCGRHPVPLDASVQEPFAL